MNSYVTGDTVRRLRLRRKMTQAELAAIIGVSPKTVSKWETARGLPDVSLLGALAAALEVSVTELMSGNPVVNGNVSGNMLRSVFYCCGSCGNIIHAMGEGTVLCCGGALAPLKAGSPDEHHPVSVEDVEDEKFVWVDHPMTREHFISFLAFVNSDTLQLVKLYPEGGAQCRFKTRGGGFLYLYCSRHGLMKLKI